MSTTIDQNAMPDQLTCLTTPLDQRGNAMVEGGVYLINALRCRCFEDAGDLYVQRVNLSRYSR